MRALLIGLLAACAVDDPVGRCRDDAAEVCARIGYPTNEYCLIVMAQDCSPEDAARAADLCAASPWVCRDDRPIWR